MLIPDHESEIDYLNYEAISQTVVRILKDDREHPFTVGIHGDWGAGKSSILKMIETELSSDENVVVLWFNGWTFEGFDDAKTVLIEAIVTELCRQRPTLQKVKEKASKLLQRVNWLKVVKRGGGVAFNVLAGLPSPDQIETVLQALRGYKQDFKNFEGSEALDRVEEIAGFLELGEHSDNLPETIHKFREDFQDLLNEAEIEQLIVLIDDLDRCLPATAIQTLEAIRLFLFVPRSAFVIGADEAMIEYAVRQHFPNLPTVSGPLTYTQNYLEKLIQVPFRIPALGVPETRIYVTLLLLRSFVGENHDGFKNLLVNAKDCLKEPWQAANLSQEEIQKVDENATDKLNSAFMLAQQIAPILAEGTKGNPRQIKRFLNTILIRQVIAEARGIGQQIKRPVLAKLMLAERFQRDFYEYMSTQAMHASDGTVSDLVFLEQSEQSDGPDNESENTGENNSQEEPRFQQTEKSNWLEREWLKKWE